MLKTKPETAAIPKPNERKSSRTNSPELSPYFAEIQKKLREPRIAKPVMKPVEEEVKKVKGLLEEKLPPPKPSTAHKRYSPVYACANTLLAKKWDDATWKRHREKIKTMKACIDNANTSKPSATREMKKNIAKQDLKKKISKENEILMERMARTFMNPSPFTNFEEAYKRTLKDLEHKSNAYLRKREQAAEKIDKENEILLKRIQNKRAHYEAKRWQNESEEHMRYLLIMTRFPEAYKKQKPKSVKVVDLTSQDPKSTNADFQSYQEDFESNHELGSCKSETAGSGYSDGVVEGDPVSESENGLEVKDLEDAPCVVIGESDYEKEEF